MRKPNITQMGHKKLLQTYKNWIVNNIIITDPKISGIIYCIEQEILSRMPWIEEPLAKKASSKHFCDQQKKWEEWFKNHSESHQ